MIIASDNPRVAAAAAPSALPGKQRTGRRSRLTRNRWGYTYVAPFFILFACFSLYPFLYTAWVSLHDTNLSNIDGAQFVGLANYRKLLGNDFFWNAARNTLTIGIIATVSQLCMALGLAHLLNYQLRGRTWFRTAMLMPYATSIAAATLVFA